MFWIVIVFFKIYDLTANFEVFWYTLNYNIIKLDMEDEQRDRK